ncbi:MAG: septal ring lytic transglycosylase RlpA family protein [Magnetospirillum sp.]|nr:septal ring lytic transglycosylase RlpA family protein [Magnetospirillum sp.]
MACVMIFTYRAVYGRELTDNAQANVKSGMASWYGAAYRGRKTASGERFDPRDLTAAHPSLPMGTLLEVSRRDLGRSVVVRVNDRGPGDGRILDLSEAAARRLDMIGAGSALVTIQVIGSAQ